MVVAVFPAPIKGRITFCFCWFAAHWRGVCHLYPADLPIVFTVVIGVWCWLHHVPLICIVDLHMPCTLDFKSMIIFRYYASMCRRWLLLASCRSANLLLCLLIVPVPVLFNNIDCVIVTTDLSFSFWIFLSHWYHDDCDLILLCGSPLLLKYWFQSMPICC